MPFHLHMTPLDHDFWDHVFFANLDLDVSENSGTPKSSILIGVSIKNHPFWGTTIFGNTHLQKL